MHYGKCVKCKHIFHGVSGHIYCIRRFHEEHPGKAPYSDEWLMYGPRGMESVSDRTMEDGCCWFKGAYSVSDMIKMFCT